MLSYNHFYKQCKAEIIIILEHDKTIYSLYLSWVICVMFVFISMQNRSMITEPKTTLIMQSTKASE